MPEYRNSSEFHSPTPKPSQRLPQGRDYRPHDSHDVSHARGWLAHLEAGRVGVSCCPTASLLEDRGPPTDPKIAANRARNEEILRRHFS